MKKHHNQEGNVVAACDIDVLGITAVEEEVTLNVTEAFYGGTKVGLDELLAALLDAETANIVGETVIGELVRSDIVEEEAIERINGVPHVQIAFV